VKRRGVGAGIGASPFPFGSEAITCAPRRVLDDAMLESLEELLIQADMGVDTALRVTANIAEGRMGRRVSADRDRDGAGRRNRPHHGTRGPPAAALPHAPAGGAGGGRERLGQDHDHRQACQPVPRRRANRW
jgi:hypothetical protein